MLLGKKWLSSWIRHQQQMDGSKLEEKKRNSSQFWLQMEWGKGKGCLNICYCVLVWDLIELVWEPWTLTSFVIKESDDNYFLWSPEAMKCIGRCSWAPISNRTYGIKNKQLHIHGRFHSASWNWNVSQSQSPHFERVLRFL